MNSIKPVSTATRFGGLSAWLHPYGRSWDEYRKVTPENTLMALYVQPSNDPTIIRDEVRLNGETIGHSGLLGKISDYLASGRGIPQEDFRGFLERSLSDKHFRPIFEPGKKIDGIPLETINKDFIPMMMDAVRANPFRQEPMIMGCDSPILMYTAAKRVTMKPRLLAESAAG